MQRLADLRARIRSLGELREVVGAMRSLAAVRVRQAQETLLAIRAYSSIVQSALVQSAPRVWPARGPTAGTEPPPATGIVAFGSEHGFVGAFNDRVLDQATTARTGSDRDRLLVVGSRVAQIAAERHHAVTWSCPMASHLGGLDDVALRTAAEIADAVAGDLTNVVLVYTRCSGGATGQIVVEALLPFDAAPYASRQPDRPPPLSNLDAATLFEKLVEELVFAQLTRAATESFASENAARLAAMESAHENVDAKLADLGRLEREGRQEEITTELLDIVTGAEAIGDGSRPPP